MQQDVLYHPHTFHTYFPSPVPHFKIMQEAKQEVPSELQAMQNGGGGYGGRGGRGGSQGGGNKWRGGGGGGGGGQKSWGKKW